VPDVPAATRLAPVPTAGPVDGSAHARLWEIDLLRTFAIVLMVVYHVAYDVDMLAPQLELDPLAGGWAALQVTCGSTFLAVVGLSFWVADRRARSQALRGVALWRRHARRGLEVLAAAILVSAATRIALGAEDAVRFGILHLIATGVLVVLPLTVRLGTWNGVLAALAVGAGLALDGAGSSVPGALVLGFDPGDAGVDWYPLLPWIGPMLAGVAAGAVLYPDGARGPLLRRLADAPRGTVLAGTPGRHALPFYLVHQPVLIVLTGGVLTLTRTDVDWP
jgi:uncharacterized membrane protein